jgi:ATP-dependent Lon protease
MDVKITLPLLPLRDIVVFPSMVIPLFVGRDKSISALNEVMKKDKKIILVTQKLMILKKQTFLCMDVKEVSFNF